MTTRPTPFDLALGPVADRLAQVDAAAAKAERDPRNRQDFASIPEVQRLLAELEDPEVLARHPQAADEYLALLHAGYRFQAAGKPVWVVTRSRLESWIGRLPPPTLPTIPPDACYLQLPPTWFWAQRDEGEPHEPLDGMFVVPSPRGDEITILAVLGLRAERGGFTQITVRASPRDFVAARAMRRTAPFAPLMEGGEAAGFHSVATAAELVTLTHLALLSVAE